MFARVPEIPFPMMWVELRATLTPELATSIKTHLQLPTASLICSVGLLSTGQFILGVTFLPHSVRAVSEDNQLSRRNRWLNAAFFNIWTHGLCVPATCCVMYGHAVVVDDKTVVSQPRPDNERIMDVQEGRSSRLPVGRRARPFCSYL